MKKLNMAAYQDELAWWQEFIGVSGIETLTKQADPTNPVVDYIAKYLKSPQDKVLDVGAGPLTQVGYMFQGQMIPITAVDPLADAYNAIPFPCPKPVTTQFGFGEDLSQLFPCDTFDIAHARNSLDHSADPLCCITEMLKVVKPGGHVILHHCRSEGSRGGYGGLHQWDFFDSDGNFYISNSKRDTVINVTRHLGYMAEQVEFSTPSIYSKILDDDVVWVDVCLRKYA